MARVSGATIAPVAEHRHQRHDAGAAADEEERAAVALAPGEMAADRPAHLDRVAGLRPPRGRTARPRRSSSRSMTSSTLGVSGAEPIE